VEARPTPVPDAGQAPSPWQRLADARLGHTVGGRLLLEKVLGVGGTASVYAARHRNGRALAVKVLHPEYAHHPGIRRRFLAEGYAANKVDHPDAVAVLDEGEDGEGNVFIVMELLRGKSLLELLAERGRLAKEQVIVVALRVLDVLAVAHDRGVLHRDIKPGNLFLTDEGAIKVLDFGIARVEDNPGAFSTRPGTTLGTPAFMAPEQAAGRLDQLDALTDLWAVGATMFQLLSGEPVHHSQTDNELLVLAATRPARSLGMLRPDLEPWLVAIVDRALSFERRNRWPNARAMRDALAEPATRAGLGLAALRSLQLSAETAPEMELPPSRPPPAGKLRRTLGWLGAAAFLVAGGASVLVLQRHAAESPVASAAMVPPLAPVAAPSEPLPSEPSVSAAGPPLLPPAPMPSRAATLASAAAIAKRAPKAPPPSLKATTHTKAAPTAASDHPNNPLFFPSQ
jgi:serine/threonine protein kinase